MTAVRDEGVLVARMRSYGRRIQANPAVTTAQHNVDIATHQVKVAEGALYPTVTLQGSVQKNYELALNSLQSFTGSGTLQYTAPIYQGGAEYAAIRQAKETQGQKQLELSLARDQARMGVAQAWAQLEAAKSSIESTKSQVKAAEAALTACARKPGSASAPPSTCSTPSRNWSTPASPWWWRSATGW